ncbi:MAG: beta-ketoacyl synthase chain length factor [Chitinophagaceae bacterium]|nr:beta-ketoacyl synthase chain length factor [Chitinophagaceae bacterium]
MKPFYIHTSCCISPQASFEGLEGLKNIMNYEHKILSCIEPDFTKYINPVQIRRMSRGLKIGFTAAIECLQRSGLNSVDAILVGTGKGCMSDTEKFLRSIIDYEETALNATYFIHSTYNQLNGMIALNKKINSYNVTYVHRGFSFEHTLIDAQLLFAEDEAENILLGSFDEMTQEHFTIKKHWNYWKQEDIQSKDLLKSNTEGSIAGEGSSFYVVSKYKPKSSCVAVKHVATLFNPEKKDVEHEIFHLLEKNGLGIEDIDFIMQGENGNIFTKTYYTHIKEIFVLSNNLYYKHLCGDYDTAINFGFWLAVKILEEQHVPVSLVNQDEICFERRKNFKHILLYNNYAQLNQSLILLSVEEGN